MDPRIVATPEAEVEIASGRSKCRFKKRLMTRVACSMLVWASSCNCKRRHRHKAQTVVDALQSCNERQSVKSIDEICFNVTSRALIMRKKSAVLNERVQTRDAIVPRQSRLVIHHDASRAWLRCFIERVSDAFSPFSASASLCADVVVLVAFRRSYRAQSLLGSSAFSSS